MHIYLIVNSINDKLYVGAKINHDSLYYGSGPLVRKARKKFGEKNFKKEILIDNIDDWEECLELESSCILQLNALVPNGYNQKIHQRIPSIEASRRGGEIVGRGIGKRILEKWRKEHPEEFLEHQRKGGKMTGEKNIKEKRGWFASELFGIRGKMNAYVLFEIDGLLQQMTLGMILKI